MMSRLTSRDLYCESGSRTGRSQVHRRSTAKGSVAKNFPTITRYGTWDREFDESPPPVALNNELGMRLLAVLARLGLSLLLTAGFAAALSLNTGISRATPHLDRACGGFFFWALALIVCTTSRRE
jgi:hypothetical protein